MNLPELISHSGTSVGYIHKPYSVWLYPVHNNAPCICFQLHVNLNASRAMQHVMHSQGQFSCNDYRRNLNIDMANYIIILVIHYPVKLGKCVHNCKF